MITISFTYSKTDEESARFGDFSDSGYYDPKGWEYSVYDEEVSKDIQENPELYKIPWKPGMLKSMLEEARDLGIDEDCGAWWSTSDAEQDMHTGESTMYSLHITGITESTRKRINRVLAR